MSRNFDRWVRNQQEKDRQRNRYYKIRSALYAVQHGNIREFSIVRQMMNKDGKITFMPDSMDVERACRELGIADEQLQAWRIQYDALPPQPPSEDD